MKEHSLGELSLATLACQAGVAPGNEYENSPPIYLTSSFCFDNAAQAAARFAGTEPGNVYSRFTNPTVRSFEQRLAALEGGDACVATSSGMSAILTVQGWLWGAALPFQWPAVAIPDWQINAALGAVIAAGVGSLLSGGVLVWMVRGVRPGFRLRHFALQVVRWSRKPARVRNDALRWGRALLLLLLGWCFLQIVM